MAVTSEQISTLGLAGVPRAAPLWISHEVEGTERPSADYTELAPTGTPGGLRTILPKGSAEVPPRPDDWFTELSFAGAPGAARVLTAKPPSRGIRSSISLTITPAATLYRAPRYYTGTDLVLSVKPLNAVIRRAHVSHVAGTHALLIRPAAVLSYHRQGATRNIQGNAGIAIVPFGHTVFRTWKRLSGGTTVGLVPDAGLVYSAAGVRNHHVVGSARVSVRPDAATLQYTEVGIAYAIAGSSTVSVTFSGHATVTRETTYATHGHIALTITPAATMEKSTGAPIQYHIDGGTILALVPQAGMALVEGVIEQHAILGDLTFGVIPKGRVTVSRAPVLEVAAPGQRRFIRIFR